MKGLYRFLFLLSSFGPLFLILAVKSGLDGSAPPAGAWVFGALSIAAVAAFFLILNKFNKTAPQIHDLVEIKTRDSDIFPYLMTYIPSLIFKDLYNPQVGVPLLVLYGLVFALYYRLDSPYLNPFFALLGYRVHEAKMRDSQQPIMLISRGRIIGAQEQLLLHEVAGGYSPIYYYDHS